MEFYFQSLFKSAYVIEVENSFSENGMYFIEMEYANGGSLTNLMQFQSMKMELLSIHDVWVIFLQLLKGVNGYYFHFSLFFINLIDMHTKNIIHGDLKADNVLLSITEPLHTIKFIPKISDFGLARYSV